MISPATKQRLGLLAVRIPPLPSTVTKEVFLPEWSTRVIDEGEVLSWDSRRDWPNTSGRLTNHPCLDIDILDDEAASAVERHVRTRFDGRGIMLLRTGRAPKRLIPFCTDTPFTKRLLCYLAPNGMPHKVEFLGAGQQAVFYGVHGETGKPYYWHADRDPIKVPPREWVRITEEEADQLLAEIDELLVEEFKYTRVAPPASDGSPKSNARVTDVDAAFQSLCYAGEGGGGNIHDIELGCINALIVQSISAEVAVEEVLAAVRIYAATNALCGGNIVAAEALRDAFDCVVIIIHHCGYDESHPRGHTSLTGAVDAEFEVVREGMLVTIKNVTMRDGPEGFEIRSVAEIVDVGEDINGKVLTSLVIVPTDAPAAVGGKHKGRVRVGTPILIAALRAALAERGSIFRPPGERAAVHAVSESEVRTRFEVSYPAGEADKAKAIEATRKAYQRSLHTAVVENTIGKGVRNGDDVLWFVVLPP